MLIRWIKEDFRTKCCKFKSISDSLCVWKVEKKQPEHLSAIFDIVERVLKMVVHEIFETLRKYHNFKWTGSDQIRTCRSMESRLEFQIVPNLRQTEDRTFPLSTEVPSVHAFSKQLLCSMAIVDFTLFTVLYLTSELRYSLSATAMLVFTYQVWELFISVTMRSQETHAPFLDSIWSNCTIHETFQ